MSPYKTTPNIFVCQSKKLCRGSRSINRSIYRSLLLAYRPYSDTYFYYQVLPFVAFVCNLSVLMKIMRTKKTFVGKRKVGERIIEGIIGFF